MRKSLGLNPPSVKRTLFSLPKNRAERRFPSMSSPIFDFSHLTPEERIQLAEELWDSLEPSAVPLTPELAAELRRRREEYRRDGDPGQPWREALDDIEQRGA
jgi:putative addiction module component (TIGR02574 family)